MSHWGNICDKCDKLKININTAIRHYNRGIASKSEIALIKNKFKVTEKGIGTNEMTLIEIKDSLISLDNGTGANKN